MELITIVILFIGGLLSGIVNTIAGGGSLISVPLLMFLGSPSHLAIGTNRFAMIFNTGTGAIEYHRKVKYNIKLALFLSLFASIGSYLGANIVLNINETMLKYVIGIIMLVMVFITLYKKRLGLEERKVKVTKRNYIVIILLSFLIGIYGGFLGAGVSTMFSFLFVAFFGMTFIKSAGTTTFIVSILSIIAALVFLVNMKIDFVLGMVLAIGFILGAKIGVKLALKYGNVWIRRLFIFLVVISSIKLFFF